VCYFIHHDQSGFNTRSAKVGQPRVSIIEVTLLVVKSRTYQALEMRPKLEYSCSIWDPYTHDNINKLEIVQRRAARYVQNNYHNTSSVTSMIDTLGWPTLAERRLKTRLIREIYFHLK
jgi:hypothetical protein